MRVCFATYSAVMMLKGGPRTQVLQTKEELQRLGVTVDLLDSWSEFDASRYDMVHLFAANIGTYHLANTLRLNGVPFVVSPIFYSRRPAPVIRSIVGITGILGRIVPGMQHEHVFRREICSWARAVLPNTTDEASLVIKGLGIPDSKVFVVPNGVEKRFASGDPEIFRKRYGSEPFILNVGHIGPRRKNVFRLIQAMNGINTNAFLIGRIEQTPEGARCLALAKKNSRIVVVDGLPHDSDLLASAYAACDVFALPSEFETPGIAALEAALAGAKIVITPHGGTRDNFADLVEYVDPSSVESIRTGIRKALAAPRSDALRSRLLELFTWQRVAERTLGVYEHILKTK